MPFVRTGDDGDADIARYVRGAGKSLVDLQSPIKKATGVADAAEIYNIRDPMESMLSNINRFYQLAAKQNVAQTIRNISELDGFGWLAEKLDGPSTKSDDSTFYLWNNGKKEYYATDPDIYRVLKGLSNTKGWGNAIPALNKLSEVFKMGTTRYNPRFIVTNILRDAVGSTVNSESWAPPLVNTFRGAMMLVNGERGGKWANFVNELVDEGVLYSGITEIIKNSPEGVAKSLQKAFKERGPVGKAVDIVKEWANALGSVNELFEVGPKVYEYHLLTRKKGMPKKEAARRAREVNLDFQRGGTQGKELNKVTAFFNAAVQGIDKTTRSYKERPGQALAKSAMYITLPSLITWALAHAGDDEEKKEYEEIPRQIKDMFWVVRADGKWIRIPKPQESGLVFGSLMERVLDAGLKKDPVAMRGFANELVDSFTPNLLPTALAPWMEVWANRSTFTGRPIIPRSKENLPPELQYGVGTSGVAKAIGSSFGVSPYNVDHIIRNTTGSVGRELAKMPDRFFGDRNREAEYLSEKPFIRDFFTDPYRSSASVDRFYELADQTQIAKNGYVARRKDGQTATADKDVRMASMFAKARRAMSELNKRRAGTGAAVESIVA